MQPLVSAGISGIGHAPVGPVEGTTVICAFQDEDTQFPIILGSLGGIPQKEGKIEEDLGTLSTGTPNTTTTYDSSGNIIQSGTPSDAPVKEEPPAKDQVVDPNQTPGLGKPGNQYTTISSAAIELIKKGEGLAKKIGNNQVQAYPDPGTGGKPWTIGYGTTRINGQEVQPGQVITIAEAERIFTEQVKSVYLPAVTSRVRGVVTQSMIDAMVSLTYNIGAGNFAKSSVLREVNAGNYEAAANAFSSWNKAAGKVLAGLTKRRDEEARLFLKDGIPGKGKAVQTQDDRPPVDSPTQSGAPSTGTGSGANTTSNPSSEFGFRDPNNKYPLYTNEPDTNRLARHETIENTVVYSKEAARVKGVETARGKTWDQSPVPYNAEYPWNKTFESESGHIMEFDDTPEAERVHLYHKKGTFFEIDHNGTRVTRVVGDDYLILERNGKIAVFGNVDVTVEGALNVLVQNSANVDISGSMNINVYNDANINVAGDAKLRAAGNLDIKADNIHIESEGDFFVKSGGLVNIESSDGMNLKSGAYLGALSSGNMYHKTSGAYYATSGAGMDLKAGGLFRADYSKGNFGMGASSAPSANGSESASDLGSIGKRETTEPEISELKVNSRQERAAKRYETEDDEGGDREEFIKEQTRSGAIDPTEQGKPNPAATPAEESTPKANQIQPKGAKCDMIYGMTTFPRDMKLSKYFTVNDMTKGFTRPIADCNGKSAQEIACNLKGVCENVMDVIKAKYPGLTITSAFRRPGDISVGALEKSQHTAGQAVDFAIAGFSRKQHFEAVQWIQQAVPYDQLILEYDAKSTVWIHVSYTYGQLRRMHFTMYHHVRTGKMGQFIYIPEGSTDIPPRV
jgi:GH24 family phage-related lysozyme (muramidase)